MTFRRRTLLVFPAAVFLAGGSLAGCGGGEKSGSDVEYVKAVCGALATFNADREKLASTASGAEPDVLARDFAGLIRELGEDLDEARPPGDVKTAHQNVVNALDDAADAVEKGGVKALLDVQLPTVQLAPDVQNRLQQLFNSTPECSGTGSIFS